MNFLRANSTSDANFIEDLFKKELNTSFIPYFKSKYVFPLNLIKHLNLYCELNGHEGCVNCLEWNQSGTLLASGSDDLRVLIWDPFRRKIVHSIETKHRGNIFSVKFLPGSNDSLIATGAADRDVYVYDVNKKLNLNDIHSHQNRVKRLETVQDVPFLFWSCGEDGFVLQHDIRCPPDRTSSLLLNYSDSKLIDSNYFETKCIAINQKRPDYIAVGCNDPYARVYDRRMIQMRTISGRNSSSAASASDTSKTLFEFNPLNDNTNSKNNIPLKFYVPGHLPNKIEEYRKRMKTLSVTFVTFSPDGNELLVNLGGEQLYLFDFPDSRTDVEYKLKYSSFREIFADYEPTASSYGSASASASTSSSSSSSSSSSCTPTDLSSSSHHQEAESTNGASSVPKNKSSHKLPPKAEELKHKANACYEEQNYPEAIKYYNRAIKIAPYSHILYSNRAATLIKRNWEGDTYAAMRDCYMALNLDRTHFKSHFKLAKCLNDLKWYQEAKECLNIFCEHFPKHAETEACQKLLRDINTSLSKHMKMKAEERAKRMSKTAVNKKKKRKNALDKIFEEDDSKTYSTSSADYETKTTGSSARFIETDEDSDAAGEDSDAFDYETDDSDSDAQKDSDTDSDSYSSDKRSYSSCESNRKKRLDNGARKIKALVKDYQKLKDNPNDFKLRYCGHCNVATDIKEANFIGENFIAAGSDDGSFFIWDKTTTNVVRVLKGDESIVNCIQPHPYSCYLATSGIDPQIRVWSPRLGDLEKEISGEHEEEDDERIVTDINSASANNQIQMNSHPFEFLFLNLTQNNGWENEDTTSSQQSLACRPS